KTFGACHRAGEQVVLATDGRLTDVSLHPTVVDLKASISETTLNKGPLVLGVAGSGAQGALGKQLGQVVIDPGVELGEQWHRPLLTQRQAVCGGKRPLLGLSLDIVDVADELQRHRR